MMQYTRLSGTVLHSGRCGDLLLSSACSPVGFDPTNNFNKGVNMKAVTTVQKYLNIPSEIFSGDSFVCGNTKDRMLKNIQNKGKEGFADCHVVDVIGDDNHPDGVLIYIRARSKMDILA
jgi:hypothetical protein